MKVLFIFPVPERVREHLSAALSDCTNLELLFAEEGDETFVPQHASTAEIMVGWRPDPEILQQAERLQLFHNPGAGMETLVDKLKEHLHHPVTVCNSHGNSVASAQHAVGMTLSITNYLMNYHQAMVEGQWRPLDTLGRTHILHGKKIGLLGYGHINQKVHQYMSGFEVEFAALKRSWETLPDLPLETYTPNQLHAFLAAVDVCIVALPFTPQTEGLIDAKALEALGENGFIVNVGRGKIIDEKALYDALKSKTIAGAAIDVWYEYQPEADDQGRKFPFHYAFQELDNVVLSPHRAASPYDDLSRWWDVIENLKRANDGRTDFLNVVDIDAGY